MWKAYKEARRYIKTSEKVFIFICATKIQLMHKMKGTMLKRKIMDEIKKVVQGY